MGGEVAALAIPTGRLTRPAAAEADLSKLRRDIVICVICFLQCCRPASAAALQFVEAGNTVGRLKDRIGRLGNDQPVVASTVNRH